MLIDSEVDELPLLLEGMDERMGCFFGGWAADRRAGAVGLEDIPAVMLGHAEGVCIINNYYSTLITLFKWSYSQPHQYQTLGVVSSWLQPGSAFFRCFGWSFGVVSDAEFILAIFCPCLNTDFCGPMCGNHCFGGFYSNFNGRIALEYHLLLAPNLEKWP